MQTVESGQMLWDKKRHWKAAPGGATKAPFPTALRALNASWHLVSHPLSTLVENRPGGVGITVVQYEPTSTTETNIPPPARPLFLHCNIVKWGIRHLMCATCPEDPAELARRNASSHPGATFQGRYENSAEGIYDMLRNGKRVLRPPGVEAWNRDQKAGFEGWDVDPERDMWMVMERIGCSGVWRDEVVCQRTREHLERTFGIVQVTDGDAGRWDGCEKGKDG